MDHLISMSNKRPHEDLNDPGYFHQSKRLCIDLGVCGPAEYGAVAECLMKTQENQHGLQIVNGIRNHLDQNTVHAAQAGVYPQVCQRCMAGESGHINHLMGAEQFNR
ncbi:hypothetical protein GJAV_G00149570 [Gymnothorax javanicus]|nr:hypothetical protein GJAV_G00149570 [Gymnothorax javanicus]